MATWEAWVDAARYPQWQALVLTVRDLSGPVSSVRLEPGWSRADAASTAPPAPAPDFPSDFRLWPISSPLRSSVASGNDGLPWLLRDGGHGVEHLVLGTRAWADAQPVEAGEVPVTGRDRAALDAWRIDEDPIVGVDATMDLAPLVTLRLGVDAQGTEVWGAAKVLRSEVLRVHLLIYGATWPSRPDTIEPTVTRLGHMSDEAMERGDPPDLSHGVGHVPLQRLAFDKAEPRFAGLTTTVDGELDGYRYWREAKGGTFDTLQWIVDWDPAAHRPLEVPAIRWLDDPPDGRP